jgi:hypothetical protein
MQKHVSACESDTLISIQERVIVGQGFHQGCGLVEYVVVVTRLRPENRRCQQPGIPNSLNTAEFVD